MARQKPVYHGTLKINGKTEEELGSKVFEDVVTAGFVRAMFSAYEMGVLGPEYDCLKYFSINE